MKIQLPVKWTEKKKGSDEEERLKRLLSSEADPDSTDDEVEVSYGKMVIDTKDIRTYNELDEDSVILRTYFNDSYCIAVNFEDFKQLMMTLTHEDITVVQRREVVVTPKKKASRRKKEEGNPEDDFLT